MFLSLSLSAHHGRHVSLSLSLRPSRQACFSLSLSPPITAGMFLSLSLRPSRQACFWLMENGLRVLIAGCDTFRAGAVEQLRTHTKHLNSLHPPQDGARAKVRQRWYVPLLWWALFGTSTITHVLCTTLVGSIWNFYHYTCATLVGSILNCYHYTFTLNNEYNALPPLPLWRVCACIR